MTLGFVFTINFVFTRFILIFVLLHNYKQQYLDFFRLQTSESFIRQIPLFTIKQYTCTNE